MIEKQSNLELYKHQKEMISAALNRKYFAYWADCGVGKTACAIKLIEAYKQQQEFKALVVAPNSVLENWQEEVKKFSELKCIILQGTRQKRNKLLNENADIFVINYEALRIFIDEIISKKFNMVVLDEAQKLKSHHSLQSKAGFKISQQIPYRLAMSGTPIVQGPLDIFAIYRCLNPFIFGFSYYRYRARYAIMGGYLNKIPINYINLDELKQKVYSCAIRVRKEDCLKLPEKIYQTHYVDLTPEQRRVYNELRKEFIAELKGKVVTAPYVLTRLLRLSQCTAGFIKSEDAMEINFDSNPKLKWLRDFINDLPADEKVVIFFRFIKELKNLRAMFSDYVEVYGETKDRQERINEFQNGKARLFFGQIQTSGLGINLHAARYCVFLSNSYSHGDRLQAEERLHRIGQSRNVTYLDCVARGTIDETILKCLKEKKDLATQILEEINNAKPLT